MRQFPDAMKASFFHFFAYSPPTQSSAIFKTRQMQKKIKISILIYDHLRVVE